MMDKNQIKESVVHNYGRLAKTKGNSFLKFLNCCDTSGNSKLIGKTIGYSEADLNAVPEDSNLGVGCGNPAKYANIQKGQTIVDLGSGAGFDAFIVSPDVGDSGKVIGIDLSDEMLALAKKNATKSKYKNVEFVKGDIENLPLDDETADHIISNCVINLSMDKGSVFKEAHRVLKKDGQISISDIVLTKELPQEIKNSVAGRIACVSGAEKIEDYMKYVSDAGFRDIKIELKASFPLELMLTDPLVIQLAKEMDYDLKNEEAKDLASRVTSITLTAVK